MPEYIYEIKSKDDTVTPTVFSEMLLKSGIFKDFDLAEIASPIDTFRNEFLDYISQHGLTSLYKFSTALEDVTSPLMSINDIEKVITKFLSNLSGAKRIVIIDPYIYAKSKTIDAPAVFKNFLSGISRELDEIVFISNGKKNETNASIHAAVNTLNPRTKIQDFATEEFHDRFWIDPDRNIGVVMGTSLNGLGNKIALVDTIRGDDVAVIVDLAKSLGAPL